MIDIIIFSFDSVDRWEYATISDSLVLRPRDITGVSSDSVAKMPIQERKKQPATNKVPE
jgi:hypothetical protein